MATIRTHRLRKSADIERVVKYGNRIAKPLATLYYHRRGNNPSRFAVVVSRRAARKSVVRNLLRRRTSEWIRKHLARFASGFDILIVFKPGAEKVVRRDFYLAIEELFRKAQIL